MCMDKKTFKKCKDCGQDQLVGMFKSDRRSQDDLATVCQTCLDARESRVQNPGEYEALYIKQKFRCAVCNCKVFLSKILVDRDQITGEIHGLLCRRCNRLLGQVKRDQRILRAVVEYLDIK